jgi:hypothetical protein
VALLEIWTIVYNLNPPQQDAAHVPLLRSSLPVLVLLVPGLIFMSTLLNVVCVKAVGVIAPAVAVVRAYFQ